MELDLLKIRVTAFLYEAGSLLLFVFVTALSSEAFSNLVMQNFGDTLLGSVILLFVSGLVKHLRNLQVIKQYETDLGSEKSSTSYPTLI